jgi:hypothetical protein
VNDTQEGVLNLVFKIADDNGLLLLDAKDLRAMLQHVGEKRFAIHNGTETSRPLPLARSSRCARAREPGRGPLLRRADA